MNFNVILLGMVINSISMTIMKMLSCSLKLILISATLFVTQVRAYDTQLSSSVPRLFHTVEVTARLVRPWDMVFLSNTNALVTEKEGGLVRVDLTTGKTVQISGLPTDLDNRNQTGLSDNAGLFAVVLDPDYEDNQWLYLCYSAKSDDGAGSTTKVIRARFKGDHIADIEPILVATPFSSDRYHYGGGLLFGADKKLYITVGERLFDEKDQPELPIAQDVSDRRGKVFRLNRDGSIPPDNPVFKGDSTPGLFALGIRAAQGLALNNRTGEIWFTEHGTRQGDEINRLVAGANYGWPIRTEGGYRSPDYQPPSLNERTFTDPAWSWETTVAPTGLLFYQGADFPQWNGSLLVSGLSRGSLWQLTVDKHRITAAKELMTSKRLRLRNVRQSPDGTLYLLTDEANGRILRMEPTRIRPGL